MIARLSIAFLALGTSLGGLYGGVATGVGAGAVEAVAGPETPGVLLSDIVASPLVLPDGIRGYVVGRYVVHYDAAAAEQGNLPLSLMLSHAANAFFFAHAGQTFWVEGQLGVAEIADGLTSLLNAEAGRPLVKQITIRQLDYLQAPEIRQPVISFER